MTTTASSGGCSSRSSRGRIVALKRSRQRRSHAGVGAVHRVGVRPQSHRRVGVSQPPGHGADVVTAADGLAGRPVAQVVQAPPCIDPCIAPGDAPPDGQKRLAEQLLGDHNTLDLVGAFVDLVVWRGRPSGVAVCRAVLLSCDHSPSRGGPCSLVSHSSRDETRE